MILRSRQVILYGFEKVNVVKNHVVKKTVYNKLVAKVNSIDTSAFVLKTKNNSDKSE